MSERQAALSAACSRLAAEFNAAESALAQHSALFEAEFSAARPDGDPGRRPWTESRDELRRLRFELADEVALVAAKRGELAAAKRALRECEEEALKQLVLAPLFPELVALIFQLVPVDVRLRCREVCRSWCAFLADPCHWRVCDLSAASGVVAERTPALLRAATERAQGALEELGVTGWRGLFEEVEEEDGDEDSVSICGTLLPVLRSNAGSLRVLRAWDCFDLTAWQLSTRDTMALLTAAPLLRVLECDAGAQGESTQSSLRLLEEPLFTPVSLQALAFNAHSMPLDVPALVARLSLHASLTQLTLWNVALDTEPAVRAVVHLASSQLKRLVMVFCHLSLPPLTQILGSSPGLREFVINDQGQDNALLVGASLPAFCATLRASHLESLQLSGIRLWDSIEDGLAVLAACTGHPTLRELNIVYNDFPLNDQSALARIRAAHDLLTASSPLLLIDM